NLSYSSGQFVSCALAFDVHEEHLWTVEEEMIVKRGHTQTVVERGGHRGIDFVFKQNGVAHHHGAIFRFGESGPGTQTHERGHAPSIDRDLHVAARESDFVSIFPLVELTL